MWLCTCLGQKGLISNPKLCVKFAAKLCSVCHPSFFCFREKRRNPGRNLQNPSVMVDRQKVLNLDVKNLIQFVHLDMQQDGVSSHGYLVTLGLRSSVSSEKFL